MKFHLAVCTPERGEETERAVRLWIKTKTGAWEEVRGLRGIVGGADYYGFNIEAHGNGNDFTVEFPKKSVENAKGPSK